MPTLDRESYLGDGLYVSHDGWQFVLRAPRLDGDHWVGLEPKTLEAFINYVDKFNDRQREATMAPKKGEF